jgi:hypothetical protein
MVRRPYQAMIRSPTRGGFAGHSWLCLTARWAKPIGLPIDLALEAIRSLYEDQVTPYSSTFATAPNEHR